MPLNIPKISIDDSSTGGFKTDNDLAPPPQPRQRRHSFSLFGGAPADDGTPAPSLLGAITNNSFLKRSMERLSNLDPDNDTSEAEPTVVRSPGLTRKGIKSTSSEVVNQAGTGSNIVTPSFLQGAAGQQRSGLLGGTTGGASALAGTNFAGANVTQDAINSLSKKKFSSNELGRWSNI